MMPICQAPLARKRRQRPLSASRATRAGQSDAAAVLLRTTLKLPKKSAPSSLKAAHSAAPARNSASTSAPPIDGCSSNRVFGRISCARGSYVPISPLASKSSTLPTTAATTGSPLRTASSSPTRSWSCARSSGSRLARPIWPASNPRPGVTS